MLCEFDDLTTIQSEMRRGCAICEQMTYEDGHLEEDFDRSVVALFKLWVCFNQML
jgi:hypothetical protein